MSKYETIKPQDLRGIIDVNINSRGRHSVLVLGAPGTGKTESILEYARVNKKHCEYIPCNKVSRESLDCIPVYDSEKEELKKMMPELADNLNKHPDGILILDELLTANSQTQSLLLSLVQQRKGFGYTIPDTVSIFATSNDLDCIGNHSMVTALGDRFSILKLEFSYQDIAEMFVLDFKFNSQQDMLKKNLKGETITKGRYENLQIINRVMMSYPKFADAWCNVELLNSMELEKKRSYLSPRTLTRVANLLDDYDIAKGKCGDKDDEEETFNSFAKLLTGICGIDFTEKVLQLKVQANDINFDAEKWDGKLETIQEYLQDTYKKNYVIMAYMLYINTKPTEKNLDKAVSLINYLVNYKNMYGNYKGETAFLYRFSKALMRKYSDVIASSKMLDKMNLFDQYRLGTVQDKQIF